MSLLEREKVFTQHKTPVEPDPARATDQAAAVVNLKGCAVDFVERDLLLIGLASVRDRLLHLFEQSQDVASE